MAGINALAVGVAMLFVLGLFTTVLTIAFSRTEAQIVELRPNSR
jgi:hypothetical protein